MVADLLAFLADLASPALFETWAAAGSAVLFFGGACAVGLLLIPSVIAPSWLRALAGFPLSFLFGGTLGILVYLAGGPAGVVLPVLLAGAMAAMVFGLWHGVWRSWTRTGVAAFVILLLFGYTFAFFGWGETADGTIRAVPGSWADGALHTLNAEAFSRRTGGDLSLPAFAGELFREPFGYDFVAGVLRRAGWTVGAAAALPAAANLACLLGWTGYLTTKLTRNSQNLDFTVLRNTVKSRFLAAVPFLVSALLLLFGNGLQWLVMAPRTQSWSPARFFGIHAVSWDKVEEIGFIWSHHVNTFASQKHFLLAAAFVVVLAGILLAYVRTRGPRGPGPMPYALVPLAIATGVLPLFHAHGFLVAGLLWLGAFGLRRSRTIFGLGLLSLVLALPTFLWYMSAVTRSGFIRVAPGYLAPPGVGSWILFWFVNLGLFLPLALLALSQRDHREARWLLGLPAVTLFLLGNLVQLQPYHWDNYKVFLFSWLLLLPLVAALLTRWATVLHPASVFRLSALTVIVFLMCLTTFSEVATYLHFRAANPIYTPYDRVVARALDTLLPRDAVVLAATDTAHRHPLTLTGRTLVAGYGGWLWTRGIAWEERSARMRQALTVGTTEGLCGAVTDLPVTHIVVGDEERQLLSPAVTTFLSASGEPSEGSSRIIDRARFCRD